MKIAKGDLEFITEEMMSNALKFSKAGSKIDVRSCELNGEYILEITDHGIGVSKEKLTQIEPFKQHDRNKFEQQGNGLGLISIKLLAEYYGGELKMKSISNEFTTCSVSIPL